MFPSMKPYVVVTLLVVFSFLAVEMEAAEVPIGKLILCDHLVEGDVVAVTENKIKITGFKYDSKGPGAWFHGQLKSSTSDIINSEKDFVTLATPSLDNTAYTCDRIPKMDPSPYDGTKDVILLLPNKITEFKTIGVLCYEACSNFGFVEIPDNLALDAADPADMKPAACSVIPDPIAKACPNDGANDGIVKYGKIKPACGTPTKEGDGAGTGTGSRLTYISGWFIVPLLLSFGTH